MATKKQSDAAGQKSARQMQSAAKGEERKIERNKGSDLKKGPERVMERAASARKPGAS
jgi:hypothetical protein